jgi:hypothetical protein
VIYPYWCLEKGYARFTGPRDASAGWEARARGWVRVMGFDILHSMFIYTFATIAFYFLGAGVLHGLGVVPEGAEMVRMLSSMYTETLGPGTNGIFLLGAFAVFYSTVFAVTAAHSRLFADFFGMLGFYDRANYKARLRVTRGSVAALLFLPSLYYEFLREPVFMIKTGGVAQAAILPVIAFVTVYLRHRRLPAAVQPGGWMTLGLWVTSVIILVMMAYSLVAQLGL